MSADVTELDPLGALLATNQPLDFLELHTLAAAQPRSRWDAEELTARAQALGWERGPLRALSETPLDAMRAGLGVYSMVGWLRDVLSVVARHMRDECDLSPSPPALSGCTLLGRWHSGEDVDPSAFIELVRADWATESDVDDPVWFTYDSAVVRALRAVIWITQLEDLESEWGKGDERCTESWTRATELIVKSAEQGAEIVANVAFRKGADLKASAERVEAMFEAWLARRLLRDLHAERAPLA